MTRIINLTNQDIIDKVKLAKECVGKEIYANQNCLVRRLLETDYNCEFQIEGGEISYDNAFDYQQEVIDYLRDNTEAEQSNQEWYEPWLCY